MTRSVQRMGILVLALAATASVALAMGPGKKNRPPMDPRGEPPGLKKGDEACYKVWHNGDGWHVHIVTGHTEHTFSGSIIVENGYMENVRTRLAKQGKIDPRWKHGPKKQEIAFDFKSFKGEEGINFGTTKTARTVRFMLLIDGKEMPEQIFVGKRGDHPDGASFSMTAHP